MMKRSCPKHERYASAHRTSEASAAHSAVRAGYAIPDGRDYTVDDIPIAGRPIRFGAQLADYIRVLLTVVVKPGDHRPSRRPCDS